MHCFEVFAMLLLFRVASVKMEDSAADPNDPFLIVDNCPPMQFLTNISKSSLLGVWFAFATTPMPFLAYQRRCATHNVKDSQYLNNSILYYDTNVSLVTYSCKFKQEYRKYVKKLRILTRTRTPPSEAMYDVMEFLMKLNFPIRLLVWLRAQAFCFEWYELKFDTVRQPITYQAPFNMLGPLGR